MSSSFLLDTLHGYEPYERVKQGLGEPGIISVYNLSNAQKAEVIAALAGETGRQILYLCESEKASAQAMEDLAVLTGGAIGLFQSREISFYQDVAASREVSSRRLETLSKLLNGSIRAVVAPIDTLLHRVMPRDLFAENTIHLSVGDRLETDYVLESLLAAGYTREYMVEGKGQFAMRGGIIDVYPTDASHAVRIEFFDDQLDSIREFDVMDQRSVGNLQSISIPPASEGLVADDSREKVAARLRAALRNRGKEPKEVQDFARSPPTPLAILGFAEGLGNHLFQGYGALIRLVLLQQFGYLVVVEPETFVIIYQVQHLGEQLLMLEIIGIVYVLAVGNANTDKAARARGVHQGLSLVGGANERCVAAILLDGFAVWRTELDVARRQQVLQHDLL